MGSFKFLSMIILLYSSGWLAFASTTTTFFTPALNPDALHASTQS